MPLCFSCMEDSICARWRSMLLLLPSTSNNITYSRTCTKWLDYSHLSPRNLVIFPSGCTVKWGWSPTSAEAQSALWSDARSPNYTRFWRGMWCTQRWDGKPTSLLHMYSSDCENTSRGHGRQSLPFIFTLILISQPEYHFFWCNNLNSTLESCFVYCCLLFGLCMKSCTFVFWNEEPLLKKKDLYIYNVTIIIIIKPQKTHQRPCNWDHVNISAYFYSYLNIEAYIGVI